MFVGSLLAPIFIFLAWKYVSSFFEMNKSLIDLIFIQMTCTKVRLVFICLYIECREIKIVDSSPAIRFVEN